MIQIAFIHRQLGQARLLDHFSHERRRSIERALRRAGMTRAGGRSHERDRSEPSRRGAPTLQDARAIDCEPLESVSL